MKTEIEGLKLKGLTIKDLLLPEFVKNIEKEGIDANAVSLVFVKEEKDGENKKIFPFVFNHKNSEEIKEKILHISGDHETDLNKFLEILKNLKK